MPHLHLPIDHTDDDLVLAANLAEIVGSEDLYVAWSHETGPGAVPEIEAVVREERPVSLASELFATLSAGCAAFWRALSGRPAERAPKQQHAADPPRRGAGEPSV